MGRVALGQCSSQVTTMLERAPLEMNVGRSGLWAPSASQSHLSAPNLSSQELRSSLSSSSSAGLLRNQHFPKHGLSSSMSLAPPSSAGGTISNASSGRFSLASSHGSARHGSSSSLSSLGGLSGNLRPITEDRLRRPRPSCRPSCEDASGSLFRTTSSSSSLRRSGSDTWLAAAPSRTPPPRASPVFLSPSRPSCFEPGPLPRCTNPGYYEGPITWQIPHLHRRSPAFLAPDREVVSTYESELPSKLAQDLIDLKCSLSEKHGDGRLARLATASVRAKQQDAREKILRRSLNQFKQSHVRPRPVNHSASAEEDTRSPAEIDLQGHSVESRLLQSVRVPATEKAIQNMELRRVQEIKEKELAEFLARAALETEMRSVNSKKALLRSAYLQAQKEAHRRTSIQEVALMASALNTAQPT